MSGPCDTHVVWLNETTLALPCWGRYAQPRMAGEEDLLPREIAERFAARNMLLLLELEIPVVVNVIEQEPAPCRSSR